jgi:hypothetical protein
VSEREKESKRKREGKNPYMKHEDDHDDYDLIDLLRVVCTF